MKTFRPIATARITQKFGKENTVPLLLKFYNSIGLDGHNGLDFGGIRGEKDYWNCDLTGEVIGIVMDIKLGNGVIILTRENGKVMKHRKWHYLAIHCKIGQILNPGDFMGWVDSTGYSTGDHVHYDLKPQIEVNGVLKNEFQGNGYFGATDPMPFYTDIFVLTYVMTLKRIEGQLAVIFEKLKRIQESIISILKGR